MAVACLGPAEAPARPRADGRTQQMRTVHPASRAQDTAASIDDPPCAVPPSPQASLGLSLADLAPVRLRPGGPASSHVPRSSSTRPPLGPRDGHASGEGSGQHAPIATLFHQLHPTLVRCLPPHIIHRHAASREPPVLLAQQPPRPRAPASTAVSSSHSSPPDLHWRWRWAGALSTTLYREPISPPSATRRTTPCAVASMQSASWLSFLPHILGKKSSSSN